VLLLSLGAGVRAGTLAEKLPAETAVYVEIDTRRLVEELKRYHRFVDPELAQELGARLDALGEVILGFASAHDFRPKLLENALENPLYFVIARKAKPVVKVEKFREPKFNPETGEEIPGEFEETTFTTTSAYTLSFVIESSEEAAAEFIREVKGLVGRLKEKSPERKDLDWKEVEVEKGEMISFPEGELTLGCHGPYVIASDGTPTELWTAISHPPERTVASSGLYQRYRQGTPPSACLAVVNVERLLVHVEADLKSAVDEARRKIEEARKAEGKDEKKAGDEEDEDDFSAWELTAAEESLKTFQVAKKAIGFEQLKLAGANFAMASDEKSSQFAIRADLELGEKPAGVLRAILDGGKRFQLPALGDREAPVVCVRQGLTEIFKSVIASLDEAMKEEFNQGMAQMKSAVGYTADEILAQLSGDAYLQIDIVEKERETYDYTPGSDEPVRKKVKGPAPEVVVLLGVNDREAFSKLLADVATQLASGPFAPFVAEMFKKRTYQGTDVYVIGPGAAGEEGAAGGDDAAAVAVVDRCLAIGTWKDVTRLVRLSKAGEPGASGKLAAVVGRHGEANVLGAMSTKWLREMLKRHPKTFGQDRFEDIVKEVLDESGLNTDWLLDRIGKEAFDKAMKEAAEIDKLLDRNLEKSWKLLPELMVVRGQLLGSRYELRCDMELRK
jgi:hypothetical protein